MARIRSIKPEFPQSESMGAISRDARLLFCLLWTICDDEGRTRAASRMLASLLFPYDDDAPSLIEGWLAELERERCIVRYTADGSTYLQVCNWLIHQKIDKPSKSRLPPFDESSRILANPREPSSLDLGPRILDLGKGSKELAAQESAPPPPPIPIAAAKAAKATRLPADWTPSPTDLAFAASERPDVDAVAEASKFRDYWHAKGGQDGRKVDWAATWRNWIRNCHSRPGARASPQSISDRVKKSAEDFGNYEFGGGNAG